MLDARMEAQIEASKEAREKDRVAADERMRVQMEESKKAREELLRKQIAADKSGSEDQERIDQRAYARRRVDELDSEAWKLRREVKRLRDGGGDVDGAQEELEHVMKKMRDYEAELKDLSTAPVAND